MEKLKIELTLDVSKSGYELVYANQFENLSKELVVAIVNGGKPFSIPATAAVKFEGHKANKSSFIKECTFSSNVVKVTLDENILFYSGTVEGRFVIYDGNNGEVVLTTPIVRIRVQGDPCYEKEHINTDESLFNTLIQVIVDNEKTTKGYMDNTKVMYDETNRIAIQVHGDSEDAKTAAYNAGLSQTSASNAAQAALGSASTASKKAEDAEKSAQSASNSEASAKSYSALAEKAYAETAAYSGDAKSYASSARISKGEAMDYAQAAHDAYNDTKAIADSFKGAIRPMGTIPFEEIPELYHLKTPGDMYNISNNFISDDRFKDGGGFSYPAGTNIYYTVDGLWDCFAGVMPIPETVDIDFEHDW